MKKINLFNYLMLSTVVASFNASADISVPQLIGDNMVLQRNAEVKIWGWSDPNERVIARLDGKLIGSITSPSGEWALTLPPQAAGGSHSIELSGNNKVTINNVTFGEVWIASGQSNMVLPMERIKEKYPEDIAQANFPDIRHFTVPTLYKFTGPQQDYPHNSWQSINPESVMKFSGTAFFFARDLYQRYQVPVGIINVSVGGSPVEAWMSQDALSRFPEPLAEAKFFADDNNIKKIQDADKTRNNNWYADINQRDAGLAEKWYQAEFDDSRWQPFTLPGYWEDQGVAPMNGVVWFRKTIDVPAEMAGKPAKLMMGRIVDADTVYVNGVEVGNITYQYPPRRYAVDAGILKAGKNVIAVRVINNRGKGGFVDDKPYWLGSADNHLDLKGQWQFKVSVLTDELPNNTFIQYKPTGLFNAMIAPAIPFTAKGFLWYQGESNTGNPANYQALMSEMIQDWRRLWEQDNMPFLFVQLANFMEAQTQPMESNWAELREQQRLTLEVPNTAMAVIIDAGEWNDIHPLDKYSPGHRLALAAQNLAYGEHDVVYSGPSPTSIETQEQSLVLSFEHIGSGLLAKGGELKEFAIAASDGKFLWAQAEIIGDKIKVWNSDISAPTQVRYGWAHNPDQANLYNKEGLPASPFQISLP